jgi:hypothetical protein
MKATRRPAWKRSAKGADKGVPGDARGGVDEQLLVEAAQLQGFPPHISSSKRTPGLLRPVFC